MPSEDNGSGEQAASDPKPGSFKPVRDAEEFRLAAIRIFGRIGWKKNLALALDVKESTLYRWISESVALPHHAASAMGAWLIVYDLTGQTPPLAKQENEPDGPRRGAPPKKKLRL